MKGDLLTTLLPQLEGASVRVRFGDDQNEVCLGVLHQATERLIQVELIQPSTTRTQSQPMVVEVMHRGGLYRFHAHGSTSEERISLLNLSQVIGVEAIQRRIHPRVPLAGYLVCWPQGTSSHSYMGRANNLGIGGLAFYLPVQLPQQSRVKLQFTGGVMGRLGLLEGEVVRSSLGEGDEWETATRFCNLAPRTAAELYEIVQTKLCMQAGLPEMASGFME